MEGFEGHFYCHGRTLNGPQSFFEAPLEPRMKIKVDPAMLSIFFVLFRATVPQTALTNFPKLEPRMNIKTNLHTVERFLVEII